jgi:branched-chain amino acid transport system ATP-binding protein
VIAVQVDKLSKAYGAFSALKDVSFTVEKGERRAIIGPNGAGKTTLFSIISGQKSPTRGKVAINGVDVSGRSPDKIWALGLTRTFQRNQLFPRLSVWENVEIACAAHHGRFLSTRRARREIEKEVRAALSQVQLLDAHSVRALDLAYGMQRQLELALALAGRPTVLLLDEPTAGISPSETSVILEMLRALPRDLTILIVEHDMDVVFSLADRITVLNLGEVLADGTVNEIRNDQVVRAVYMGGSR